MRRCQATFAILSASASEVTRSTGAVLAGRVSDSGDSTMTESSHWLSTCNLCGSRSVGSDLFDRELTYCNPRSGGCGARRPRDSHAADILEIIAQRKIDRLIHITKLANLESILSRGLMPRSDHAAMGIQSSRVDAYRRDGSGHTNLSITFGNGWMFRKLAEPGPTTWVALLIEPAVLAMGRESIEFHQTNAATMDHRFGREATDLEAMFNQTVTYRTSADTRTWARDQRAACVPTDDQAEVTVKRVIHASRISEIWFGAEASRERWTRLNGQRTRPRLAYRPITEWWRPEG